MALYDVSTSEKKASPELVSGGTLYSANPVGTILPFGGTSIPSGWGLCDGSAVSRTTYSELFAVIGTSFGSGDGSSTFNLPDMRESVPKGAGENPNGTSHVKSGGLSVGEFLDDRIQNIGKMKAQATSGYSVAAGGIAGYINAKSDLRTGVTTEVKSVGVNYIICMKQIGVPADFLAKVDEAVEEYIDDNAKSPISSSNKLVTESEIYPYKRTTDVGYNVLSEIKTSADAVADYKMFSGNTQTGMEGSWFGFRKTANFWHCEVFNGQGGIIHVTYNNGTYTQRVII